MVASEFLELLYFLYKCTSSRLVCRLCTASCIRNHRNINVKLLLSLLVHYHHIMKVSIDDLSHVLRQP